MLRGLIDQVLLTFRLLRDARVPLWTKAVVLLPVLYFISPIDIIPDVLLGIGQLDDLGLILGSMRLFEALTPEYIVQEHRDALRRRHQPLDVIDGDRLRSAPREKPKRG